MKNLPCQLDDRQSRIGGGHPTGCYCGPSDGGYADSNGRSCVLTPSATQFQCNNGVDPTTGFAVGSGGSVTCKGSSKLYACPATNSEYNAHTSPVESQEKCVEIFCASARSFRASSGEASQCTCSLLRVVRLRVPQLGARRASQPSAPARSQPALHSSQQVQSHSALAPYPSVLSTYPRAFHTE